MSEFTGGAAAFTIEHAFALSIAVLEPDPKRVPPRFVQLVDPPPLTQDMREFVEDWLDKLSAGEAIGWEKGIKDTGETRFGFLGKYTYLP